jgi:hypothetical protein
MIERWLQITCDNPDCGETTNSTMPNMTVVEFLRAEKPPWRRVGKKHACSKACAAALRWQP